MSPRTEIRQLLANGSNALAEERFTDAAEAFGAAVELEPANLDALAGYASALRQSGRTTDAEHIVHRAIFYDPNDKRVLTELGILLVFKEDYAKAVAAFDQALALDPVNQQAYQFKIQALRKSGLFEASEKTFQEASAQPLADPKPILREHAWALWEQKNYDAAVEAFALLGDFADLIEAIEALPEEGTPFVEAAVLRFPREAAILNPVGAFYLQNEQFPAAALTFSRCLAADPDNEQALTGRIQALRRSKPAAAAESAVRGALARLPHSADILTQATLVYFDQGRFDEAVEALAQMEESSAAAFFYYLNTHDLSKAGAAALLEAASRRFAHSGIVLANIGNAYDWLGDFEKALAAAGRAITLEPDLSLAWQIKIKILRERGAVDQAIEAIAESPAKRNRSLLLEIASTYIQKGRYAEAAEALLGTGDPYYLRERIVSMQRWRRFREAEQLVEAALEMRPGDAELLSQRAWIYRAQSDFERAVVTFDEALRAEPNDVNLIVWKTYCLRVLRRIDEAGEILDAGISRLGQRVALLNERGWLHYDQKQYAQALRAFDEALKIDPKNADALRWRIRSLAAQRQWEEAEKYAAEALELQPENALLLYEQGRLYYRREDFSKAEQCYREAHRRLPSDLNIAIDLAALLNRLDLSLEAREIFEKLRVQHFLDDTDVVMHLGWFHMGRNDLAAARKQFDILKEKAPESTSTRNSMGALYFNEQKYAEAEREFRRGAEKDPFESSCQSNIAWAILYQVTAEDSLYDRGSAGAQPAEQRLEEAEKYCRKALELDPNYSSAYACLGLIAAQRGSVNEAIDSLREAIQLEPQRNNYDHLGILYLRVGRFQEAREMFKTGCKVSRMDPQPRLELGKLELQGGDRKEALRLFREAAALDPGNDAAPRELAIALIQGGEFGEARRVLREALRSLPEDRRWQIHLTLGQLLTVQGDAKEERELYQEALQEVKIAMDLKPNHPDPYFHAGVVHFKLDDLGASLRCFQRCKNLYQLSPKRAPLLGDAEQNIARIQARVRSERLARGRSPLVAGALTALCAGGLLGLWYLYFTQPENPARISPAMLTTLTPLLLVLTIFSALIPYLVQRLNLLKLPGGLEVGLHQPKDQIPAGQSGAVGFGSAAFTPDIMPSLKPKS